MISYITKEKMMKKIDTFTYTHKGYTIKQSQKFEKVCHTMYYADGSDLYETRGVLFYEIFDADGFQISLQDHTLLWKHMDKLSDKFTIYFADDGEKFFGETSIRSLKSASYFISKVLPLTVQKRNYHIENKIPRLTAIR